MRILWSESAVLDLESIKEYIARDSDYYACSLVERILHVAGKIVPFPGKGRKVQEMDREDIREIIYGNYRIIYQIGENEIIILGVIHGARNLKNIDLKPWELC